MSDIYPSIQNTSGITNASFTEIVVPITGRGFLAKLRDSSGWKLSLDSAGATYMSILCEFEDRTTIKKGQRLLWGPDVPYG